MEGCNLPLGRDTCTEPVSASRTETAAYAVRSRLTGTIGPQGIRVSCRYADGLPDRCGVKDP